MGGRSTKSGFPRPVHPREQKEKQHFTFLNSYGRKGLNSDQCTLRRFEWTELASRASPGSLASTLMIFIKSLVYIFLIFYNIK